MPDPTDSHGAPRQNGGSQKRSSWRHWVLGIAALLLAIFIALNAQKVKINFIFGEAQAPLIFALLIATALGALIGWAAPKLRRPRRGEQQH